MKDFQVKEQNQIYSGRVVKVSVETIVLPSGRETIREVVQHPGAAAIVPMISPGEVLLLKQFRYCTRMSLWEIPAGTLETGETPAACAERELIEETGYRAGKMQRLSGFFTTPGFCNEFLHLFLATELRAVGSNLEKDEQIEVHPLSLPEALRKIEAGEIVDAKTIIGLLVVSRMKLD